MIERSVFYLRLDVCKACEFWRGACLKGHALSSDLGCPVQKFEGVGAAGYAADQPVPISSLPEVRGTGCCGAVTEEELKPLAWVDVWKHLTKAVLEWKKAGFPITSQTAYNARINACKQCPKAQYKWFQCKHCKCIVYSKAKLATETCPFGLWPAGM